VGRHRPGVVVVAVALGHVVDAGAEAQAAPGAVAQLVAAPQVAAARGDVGVGLAEQGRVRIAGDLVIEIGVAGDQVEAFGDAQGGIELDAARARLADEAVAVQGAGRIPGFERRGCWSCAGRTS
ncbi:hypothetical protein CATMIT_01826, partial [Catenibacterium mitsuokai DSM 15897]